VRGEWYSNHHCPRSESEDACALNYFYTTIHLVFGFSLPIAILKGVDCGMPSTITNSERPLEICPPLKGTVETSE